MANLFQKCFLGDNGSYVISAFMSFYIITFISYWLIGFPVSYFLGSDDMLGSEGIWIGLLCGLTIAATLLYIRFNILTNRLITKN